MTIEKIKHYIGQDLYNFWTLQTSRLKISEASNELRKEIESGLLSGIRYGAELKLLEYLLEKNTNTATKQPVLSREHSEAIERAYLFNTIEN